MIARMADTGVNLIIDVEGESGLHEGARLLLRAIQAARIPSSVVPITWGNLRSSDGRARSRLSAIGHRYPVNILCYNLNQLQGIGPLEYADLTQNAYTIGYWAWELPIVAEEHVAQIERVHEIWVPSQFTAQAFATVGRPARVVPHPVCVDRADASDPPVDLPPGAFVFLFTFSAMSSFARKNPLAVVEAFRLAFGASRDDGPLLVVKAHCGEEYPEAMRALRAAVEGVHGRLIEDNYTRGAMLGLIARADCYVSLHRSEAFGLGMAESMWHGTPVVATGYSGNLEYMNYLNSFLVDYTLREITAGDHALQPRLQTLYPVGQIWAEPSVERAARLMAAVHERPDEARERGLVGAVSVQRHFSAARVGDRVRDYLRLVDTRTSIPAPQRHMPPVGSLDFTFDAPVPGNGWHAPEQREIDGRRVAYRWTSGAIATFEVALSADRDLALEVELVAGVSPEVVASLQILADGEPLAQTVEHQAEGLARLSATVPREILCRSTPRTRFDFRVARTIRPSDDGVSDDTRRLGVAISRLCLRPAGA
jgi:glycosyltransferase involved in cell wall biosynthesis